MTVCYHVTGCPGSFEVISGDGPLHMAIFELLEYIVNEVKQPQNVSSPAAQRSSVVTGLATHGIMIFINKPPLLLPVPGLKSCSLISCHS